MTKVVVLGSNSFSGADFVDLLLSETNYQVIGSSRSLEKNEIFLPYRKNRNIARFTFRQFDLNTDIKELLAFLDSEKPEYVVNFAAQSEVAPSWDNPDHWYQTNGVAIVRLTNYLKDSKYLKKYVHISSPEIYGTCSGNIYEDQPYNPSTPYAASKAAGDMFIQTLIKNFNFPAVLIRSTNVYGPGQQLFKIIMRSIIYLKLGKKIQLHGGGKAVKSYIHIRDISRGELAAMQRGKNGSIYHLSPDKGYSVRSVVEKICQIMGKDFEQSTEVVEERLGQDAVYEIKSDKARSELGWKPQIDIDTGLKHCVDWVEQNWEIIKKESHVYVHKQ